MTLMRLFCSLVTLVTLCTLAVFSGGTSGAQDAGSRCQQLNAELFGPAGAAVEYRKAHAAVAEAKQELAADEAREERYRQMEAAWFLNTGHASAADEKNLEEARTQRIKTEGVLKTAQAALTRSTDAVVNLRKQLAARGCRETPPGGKTHAPTGNSSWNGTFKMASKTITIGVFGDGLKGDWYGKSGDHGATDAADFSCKITGEHSAQCDYSGSFSPAGPIFSGDYEIVHRVGTINLSSAGTTIKAVVHEVSDQLEWNHGVKGYTPAIHPGAVFYETWTRQ